MQFWINSVNVFDIYFAASKRQLSIIIIIYLGLQASIHIFNWKKKLAKLLRALDVRILSDKFIVLDWYSDLHQIKLIGKLYPWNW